MPDKPRILFLAGDLDGDADLRARLEDLFEVVTLQSSSRALARLARESFAGVYVASSHLAEASRLGRLVQSERILEGMPDGVGLLDSTSSIVWANERLRQWSGRENVVGENFYAVLGSPEILGPDFCPFHTALATGTASNSTLRCGENQYLQIHATPLFEDEGLPHQLLVTVRDISREILQQQKLAAIHQAGIELADLKPDEVADMTVAERIELLKSNILHYTKDLLTFEVVEIRMLDQKTNRLETLLAVGIEPEAVNRVLMACPTGNGVTGFVAATGKSYLCEDTAEDPLYLEGARGARSSLTVPLTLHEQVIGTFNVESLEPRAFGESDLQFLEIFSRDVAVALNTLELLAAAKASTAAESVEAIHSAVALPVDGILNDAVNVMECYIGHAPDVVERLQRILRNARDIKQVIHKVGQKMAPLQAQPQGQQADLRPALVGCRVLVVDADESVRSAAHALLERYGCVVETAHDGNEAIFMVRNLGQDVHYDVIIADIRLPDVSGYDLLLRLQQILDDVPLVLMTGFGYDPGHSIVKARRAGLKAVLYKPFRLDQLLETVQSIFTAGR
ncbi:MAG: two-component system response regulator [Planctomycetes bacterium RBG_16_64_10]|nr:MAG: two-component system response regulator [Planctomycetes bacterium RBG_16_64_10]